MKLGFYTNYSEGIAQFAQEVGFRSLQLSAWPQSALNADTVTDERIAEVLADLERRDLEVSALGYYPNPLDPDPATAAETQRYLVKVIELAQRMGVPVVSTFAGRMPDRSVADCLPAFKEAFTPICAQAEERGVRIAIENCPMINRLTLRSKNIAFSPEVWDAMFEAVPSSALGIELDPSHMIWLGIDYVQAVHDYGARIFHIHAKDADVDRKALARVGIYGQAFGENVGFGHGWWRFRSPGWGEVQWPRLISALLEVGYQGNLDIEHEDEVFARAATIAQEIAGEADIVATFGRERSGLVLGYRYLSQLIPPPDGATLLPR